MQLPLQFELFIPPTYFQIAVGNQQTEEPDTLLFPLLRKGNTIGEESWFTIQLWAMRQPLNHFALEGMNKLQRLSSNFSSSMPDIFYSKKLSTSINKEKPISCSRKSTFWSIFENFNFRSAIIDANLTYFTCEIASKRQQIATLQETKFHSSKAVQDITKEMEE